MLTFDRWINKINTEVLKFISQFNENYDCECAADFGAYPLDGELEWSLIYVENGGELFYKDFIKRFPKSKGFNLFTLSLLHELGHLETSDKYIEDDDIRCGIVDDKEYFKLHNEVIATDWAGNWITNNITYAKKIDKKFSKLIQECYKDLLTE